MIHRVTFHSSPRLLLLSAVPLLLVAGGIFLAVFDLPIVGLVVLAGGLVLGYLLYRAVSRQPLPWVETSATGIAYHPPDGATLNILWKRVTLAGLAVRRLRRPVLFLYEGSRGRLLQIPSGFSGFRRLEQTIRARTRFQRVALGRGEKLEDRLRQILR